MNLVKFSPDRMGNALFYVLLGVVLLAALSYNIIRQDTGTGAAQQLSNEKAEIYAAQIINHAAAVKGAIDQMLATGSTIDDIDFVLPEEAGYDTPPHQHKVFHPGGGGINPMVLKSEMLNPGFGDLGWVVQANMNTEWTPSTQTDILYTYRDVPEAICLKINKRITGQESVSRVDNGSFNQLFFGNGTDAPLNEFRCAHCVGYSSLCVQHATSDNYAFYTLVAAR